MNTNTNTKAKAAAKQIVVNVSDESKAQINTLKEQFELTDKEFITILLEIFENTDEDIIQNTVEKFVVEKQTAKIEARIALLQGKIEKAKGEIGEVASTTETSNEAEGEVVYDAANEVEA